MPASRIKSQVSTINIPQFALKVIEGGHNPLKIPNSLEVTWLSLKNDQSSLKNDQSSLKNDQSSSKNDQSSFKSAQSP
jgi:hypothetical protein